MEMTFGVMSGGDAAEDPKWIKHWKVSCAPGPRGLARESHLVLLFDRTGWGTWQPGVVGSGGWLAFQPKSK